MGPGLLVILYWSTPMTRVHSSAIWPFAKIASFPTSSVSTGISDETASIGIIPWVFMCQVTATRYLPAKHFPSARKPVNLTKSGVAWQHMPTSPNHKTPPTTAAPFATALLAAVATVWPLLLLRMLRLRVAMAAICHDARERGATRARRRRRRG